MTGLRREGSVLIGPGLEVVAGGGAPERLAAALATRAAGAAGIISFGMAGALDPDLRIGDWVIGTALRGGWEGACDELWTAAIAKTLPDARSGHCYADGRLIADPAEKSRLGKETGALAADMESHIAAEAAERAGLPFAILRCISDEAASRLTPAIAVAMKPSGGLALGAIFRSLASNPGQLPKLLANIAIFNSAFARLKTGAQRIGPRAGFDQR